MIRNPLTATILALSAAAGVASPAAAEPRDVPISAIYHPSTQRFCVRATTLEEAESIRTGIYQRQCLTARQWQSRGVRFEAPVTEPRLARM
jgi:hypothetical protein